MANNKDLEIYGTDFSQGMLRKAHKIIKKWSNLDLFQADSFITYA